MRILKNDLMISIIVSRFLQCYLSIKKIFLNNIKATAFADHTPTLKY